MSDKPEKICLYAYDVYFGDSFCLCSSMPEAKNAPSIDFGSTGKGKPEQGEVLADDDLQPTGLRLTEIAAHIKKTCDGVSMLLSPLTGTRTTSMGGLKDASKISSIANQRCDPALDRGPRGNRDLKSRTLWSTQGFPAQSAKETLHSMLSDMHESQRQSKAKHRI